MVGSPPVDGRCATVSTRAVLAKGTLVWGTCICRWQVGCKAGDVAVSPTQTWFTTTTEQEGPGPHLNDPLPVSPLFEKHNNKLATIKLPSTKPPYDYTRPKFDTVDYWLIQNWWKNSVKKCEPDTKALIKTDHFPLTSSTETNFKSGGKTTRIPRTKYEECNKEQKRNYNNTFKDKISIAEKDPKKGRSIFIRYFICFRTSLTRNPKKPNKTKK